MAEDRSVPVAPGEAPGREFHEVAELFPLLRGAAFEELAADIQKNGLREPILCDAQGRILDGRNRYRACLRARVEPRFVTWEGGGTPADLALSLNLKRRHLNESQRAMVAARLAKRLEAEAIQRRGLHGIEKVADLPPFPTDGKSRSRAAEMVNVSPRLVSSAIKIIRDGCAEMIAAVESGQMAVTTACNVAGLSREEQTSVLAGGAQEVAKKLGELRGRRPRQPGGTFAVIQAGMARGEAREIVGEQDVVLLCLGASRLREAIQALEGRGFRRVPGAG